MEDSNSLLWPVAPFCTVQAQTLTEENRTSRGQAHSPAAETAHTRVLEGCVIPIHRSATLQPPSQGRVGGVKLFGMPKVDRFLILPSPPFQRVSQRTCAQLIPEEGTSGDFMKRSCAFERLAAAVILCF